MGQLTGGDPSLLRRINSAVVLHALRTTDCATLTEITRVTGLSRPTVEGVVEGLIEGGLVVETAAEDGGARRQGRPARRFRFRAEAGHLLGLEIGTCGRRACPGPSPCRPARSACRCSRRRR
ncbi:MarR family transcriptional regulator, partial [Streptomyces olivaceoviridis]